MRVKNVAINQRLFVQILFSTPPHQISSAWWWNQTQDSIILLWNGNTKKERFYRKLDDWKNLFKSHGFFIVRGEGRAGPIAIRPAVPAISNFNDWMGFEKGLCEVKGPMSFNLTDDQMRYLIWWQEPLFWQDFWLRRLDWSFDMHLFENRTFLPVPSLISRK